MFSTLRKALTRHAGNRAIRDVLLARRKPDGVTMMPMQMVNEAEKPDEGLKDDFTCGAFSLEAGFMRCKPENHGNFSAEEVREREQMVAPFDPQPVEGGFIPRNNVFNRM